jgi:hypothetical protein
MKTVKQLTVSLQLSKVTIYKALKHDDLQKHITKDGNITYVDDIGEQILVKMFSKVNSKADSKFTEHFNSQNDITIQALINQLEVKDKQIADLTETIKNLSQSINAGQQNQLAETIIESLPPAEQTQTPIQKKISLWSKIFKNKKQ